MVVICYGGVLYLGRVYGVSYFYTVLAYLMCLVHDDSRVTLIRSCVIVPGKLGHVHKY